MKYKVYTTKEFQRILKNNGYCQVRQKGSHTIWVKENCGHISVPIEMNPMIARRLIKEYHLIEN